LFSIVSAVAEGQITVAAELAQDTNDRHQLTPMLAKTEEMLAAIGHDEEIGVCLADAGYWDTDALEAIVERGQRLIVNPDTANPRRPHAATPHPRAPKIEGVRLVMHETLASDEGRALYATRRELAETVFGQTKVTRRADSFLRRGLDACQSEWRLICATHNLLKLWRQPAATGVTAGSRLTTGPTHADRRRTNRGVHTAPTGQYGRFCDSLSSS